MPLTGREEKARDDVVCPQQTHLYEVEDSVLVKLTNPLQHDR